MSIADLLRADGVRRHAEHARLQRIGPVHRIALRSGKTGWLVIGYEAARQALNDLRLQSRSATLGDGRQLPDKLLEALNSHMLNYGPPDHTRMRRLVAAVFTRRHIEQMRPRIQQLTDDLLNAMDGAREADLIASLALPLPLQVLADLLGIPDHDRASLHRWTTALTSSDLSVDQLSAASAEMLEYIRAQLERKRRDPQADLLSSLVSVQSEGDRLSEHELTSMAFLLLVAGHETTLNLIGNGILTLLSRPDRLAALRADMRLLPSAIEEILRYESPVQLVVRFNAEPVELAGVAGLGVIWNGIRR